jgi:PAS domain S-box-containing protein
VAELRATWTSPLLDLLFEEPGVGRCLVAPDGSVLRANSEWLRSAGFDLDEVLGADIIELFPETRDMALTLHARARAGHRVEVPRHAQRVLGRETWWEGSISPVEMDCGTGLLITAREVTERVAHDRGVVRPGAADHIPDEHDRRLTAERALRESETRYRLLFKNMLDGFAYCRMVFDENERPVDFVYLDVNDAFERLTGLRDVVGKPVSEVIPRLRETEPELLETYGRVARTGRPERLEVHFRPLALWLAISVYSPRRDHFVAVFDNITERKRAEESLRHSEARYRALFTSVTEGFTLNRALYDETGKLHDFLVLEANPSAERFNGLKREDFVGKTWRDLWPGAEQYWWDICNDVMHRGKDVRYDNYAKVHDRWYDVHQFRVAPDLMGSIFTDVTDRKRAEEALRRERRLFDSVTKATDVMLVYLDPAFNFVWVNDAYAASCNMRPEEIVGKNHFTVFPHEENEAIFRRVRESGEPVFFKDKAFEFPDQPERGVTYWDWSLVPVRDVGGTVLGLVFSLRETTKYKLAELALRESEQRYSAIFDKSPFAIALTRMPGGITVGVNDAFLQLFEYSREEMIGKSSVDLGISDVESRAHVAAALRERGSVRDYECTRTTKSGARHVLSLNQDWVRIDGEDLVLTTIVDITDRRRAEEALRRASEAVTESNARLVEADRRKNEFLGMLSHELRNPLAPIRNSVYIMQRVDPTGDQAARARAVIERQTEHLARLVDDLLDVTRIVRGKIELRREHVDLCEVVRRTAEDHRSVIERNDVKFQVEVPNEKVWAEADATRLAQVIGNLLQNAAKFTRLGDSVTLTLRSCDRAAEISVRDTGEGIDPALLPELFQPFVQGDRTLARTEGGLGLGLAFVKGIVQLHGGTVRAHSAGKGRGADFIIRLPVGELAASQDRLHSAAPREPLTTRRVLIVDDSEDAADSMAELVRMLGHTSDVAYDGPSALERARSFQPDVVLCDIGLPGMSGYEIAKALRASVGNTMRLVAVTGYAQPNDVKAAVDAGFDQHVAKPASTDDIARILR